MFRYLVTVAIPDINHEVSYEQEALSRLTPLDKAADQRLRRRFVRKFPNAQAVEVQPIEETDYRIFKDFHNSHED